MRFVIGIPLAVVAAVVLSTVFFIDALNGDHAFALAEGVLAAAFAILACALMDAIRAPMLSAPRNGYLAVDFDSGDARWVISRQEAVASERLVVSKYHDEINLVLADTSSPPASQSVQA